MHVPPGSDVPISLLACTAGLEEIRGAKLPEGARRISGPRAFGATNLKGVETEVTSVPVDGVRSRGGQQKTSGVKSWESLLSAFCDSGRCGDLNRSTPGRQLCTATFGNEGDQTDRLVIGRVTPVAEVAERTPLRGRAI